MKLFFSKLGPLVRSHPSQLKGDGLPLFRSWTVGRSTTIQPQALHRPWVLLWANPKECYRVFARTVHQILFPFCAPRGTNSDISRTQSQMCIVMRGKAMNRWATPPSKLFLSSPFDMKTVAPSGLPSCVNNHRLKTNTAPQLCSNDNP